VEVRERTLQCLDDGNEEEEAKVGLGRRHQLAIAPDHNILLSRSLDNEDSTKTWDGLEDLFDIISEGQRVYQRTTR